METVSMTNLQTGVQPRSEKGHTKILIIHSPIILMCTELASQIPSLADLTQP